MNRNHSSKNNACVLQTCEAGLARWYKMDILMPVQQQWQLNPDEIYKVLDKGVEYCRICFKSGDLTSIISVKTVDLLNAISKTDFICEKSLSNLICHKCLTDIDSFRRFRLYLHQSNIFLGTILKNEKNIYNFSSGKSKGFSSLSIIDEPTDAYYDEEWLDDDGTTIELYEEISKSKENYEKKIHTFCDNLKLNLDRGANRQIASQLSTRSKITNEDGQYECPQCNKTYSTQATVNKHIYRVHSPATETCKVCNKIFNPYKLQCHMHFHKLKHKCQFCNKSFPHPSNLATHIKKQHTNSSLGYSCPTCNLDLTTKKLLRLHLLEKHGYIEDIGTKTPVECHYCGRQYQNKSSIINHFRRGCDKNSFSSKPGTLQCRICNIKIKSSSELTSHMKIHTTKYECDYCKARFTHKFHYKRHLDKHKNQCRPFQCDTCGASYGRIEHVKAHIARTHTKDFKQNCKYCNKGFISINELKDHERIHTNERPFPCTVSGCQNTFRTRSALKNHLIRHTNYYYPCKYCFKKFRNINNIVNHCKKIHQNRYKSDDELDFTPVTLTSDKQKDQTEKTQVFEMVIVSGNHEVEQRIIKS